MRVEELKALYGYGDWANQRVFQGVSQLTPEQYTQPFGGQYASIRDILVHMINAEWIWLERCGGPERGPALAPADYTTASSVWEVYREVEGYRSEFLSRLADEDMTRQIEFTTSRGEKRSLLLGELLQQPALHGVHHRGQIALALQMLGQDIDNFDIILYHAERRGITIW